MTTRLITRAGLACLVVGPTALLGQALLTPVTAGGDAADQVADAASDLSAMRWALLLDAPVLLLVPAVLFGFVLLAIALWRTQAVPRWAAVAVGALPVVGFVLSPAGAALAVAGFGACAVMLRRGAVEPSLADASAPVTTARI